VEDVRQALKSIYKAGMILVTATFATGAVAAWWYSTPANQLLLIAGILGILALICGLSIDKLERRDAQAETLRSVIDDMRSIVKTSSSYEFAEPEVHRVDQSLLDEARDMQSRGESIDTICRRIDPAFDGHGDMHQEALRRMVRAMLAEGQA
jgi:hypothetical protein